MTSMRVRKAMAATQLGDHHEAAELMDAALADLRQSYPHGHRDLIDGLSIRASIAIRSGATQQAKPLLAEALAMERALAAPRIPFLTSHHNNLAFAHAQLGENEQAERHYRLALQTMLDSPIRDPIRTARAHWSLGAFLAMQGQWDEAKECMQRAIRLREGMQNGNDRELMGWRAAVVRVDGRARGIDVELPFETILH
ncbi:hypothetical protein AY599_02500 [Leptolyngbya valderiana BDU 20041]|nr:hypothetical protein AY599_02500 [Leptolyngbya valderiana BDU 20041]